MKRVHHLLRPPQQISGRGEGSVSSPPPAVDSMGKGKAWQDTVTGQNVDAGMDGLLEVLGYKVRSSDMAEVAHRLEQLEQVIGNTQDQDGLTNIVSDTVHYNPSDLFSWLESMLSVSGLNPPPNFGPLPAAPVLDASDPYFAPADSSPITSLDCSTVHHHQSQLFEDSSSEYDLKAIPGRAIYSSSSQAQAQAQAPATTQNDQTSPRETKRLKQSHVPSSSPTSPSMWGSVPAAVACTQPLVPLDSQENGIRLVQALTACAEALQQEDLKLAELLMKRIEFLAASQAGAMGKVAVYFANAIAHRIYRRSPQNDVADLLSDSLQMHFYDTCPYLKFAHFTANQAILDAFAGKKHVHVIDFSMNQGLQWPMFMQALAVRSEGPPTFRLTGIGPPSADGTDRLQDVGWKLARLAEDLGLKFRYRGFVAASLADLDASTLDLKPGEAVAVNSVFELHRLLAWPGAIEKVLSAVRDMKPEIVTVVEQEASHNGPVFQERFMQALHFYSSMFDSLEGAAVPPCSSPSLGGSDDMLLSEMYLGKQICNVVACEGTDRVERHETLDQWRERFVSAGFAPVHIGSDAYKQASMLLAMFAGGNGYRVDENGGCLLLGWQLRPLIASSAWRLASRGGGPKQVMRPS